MPAPATASPPFPRLPLFSAAALVGLTILAAGWGRLSGPLDGQMFQSQVVEERALRFVDLPDGGVAVLAGDLHRVATLAPGTNGFARGLLRGLARDRKRQGAGPDRPFVLTRWADGHITLADPTTSRLVALDAFGPTNAGVFAGLMDASRSNP